MHYMGFSLFQAQEDEFEAEPTDEWRFAITYLKHRLGQHRTAPLPSKFDLSFQTGVRISAIADDIASREALIRRMQHLRNISRGRAKGTPGT
jgi:hypothetical protein